MLAELVAGVIIGLILGLLGGGGALMAIPVLLYVFDFPFRMAVGSSLALVLVAALPAIMLYVGKRQVDWLAAVLMGSGGMLGAAIGSRMSDLFAKEILLWLLIVLMGFSAYNMLKGRRNVPEPAEAEQAGGKKWVLLVAGFAIGILTGLVGVGGGFLLVPALIFFGNLPARKAIASSLVIIGLNALSGVMGYMDIVPLTESGFQWLVGGSLLGSIGGFFVSFRLNQAMLKKGFGVLLIALMALLILMPPGA